MAGRGRGRKINAGRRKNEENKFDKPESLTLQDVQCTVCMGIFVEPVTLPCYHTTCKVCFEKTIDNNTLACPLCRKYVGTWVRQRQKNGLMVNQALWAFIRQQYDSHVQKKLKGEDDEEIDGLAELNIPTPKICEPGVIRQEYEAEQKRIQEEALKRQQLEVQASERLIKELQEREEEEKRHLEELKRKAEEEDALIAQRIAAQLEAEDARKAAEEEENLRRLLEEEQASSAFVRLPSNDASVTPSQATKKGPMDMFLSQNNLGKSTRTGSSSSTDSLHSEMHHFRPVHYVPTTPPKSSPEGLECGGSEVRRPVPVMRNLDGWASTSVAGPSYSTLRPWLKTDTSCVRKSINEDPSSSSTGPDKRDRSPDTIERTPKRARRESPRKTLKSQSVQFKSLGKLKESPERKRTKQTGSDSETDCEGEFSHFNGSEHSRKNNSSSRKLKPSNGVDDILPLTLEEFSGSAALEKRYQQEQEDYEYALKLQKELNALQNQSRSYELRSIVSLSPKKSQPNIVTPRRKAKPKQTNSTGKKEKRRQCTLEESMGFSVKMEL